MNTLVSQSVEKGEKTRTFTVELANDEASLFMKFVGDKYYLNDAGYTAAPADAAKKGNYLALDLYSADGYLHKGTYTPCTEGGVIGEGQFGIGYDTTVDWGWGPMEMKDWGTCWWTVTDGTITAGTYQACTTGGTVGEGEFGIGYDGQWGASGTTWYTVSGGAASGTYITDGSVTVEVDGDTYTIIIESSIINAKYVGTLTL